MFFSLELVELRNPVRDVVIVAFVSDKDVIAGFEAGWLVECTNGDANALFPVHSVEEARPAFFAKPAFGEIGGFEPFQAVVADEGDVCELRVGRSPEVTAGAAALAAMAERDLLARVIDLERHRAALALSFECCHDRPLNTPAAR